MNEEETKALIEFFVALRNNIDDLISQLSPIKSIDELKAKIPSDMRELLSFEETEQFYIIKPRQYLGTENFARILDSVRQVGGQYISKGKDSHFKVPKGQP
jgi:isocitrate/isopropylmalate dehydrogenase